jgi:three-Cys-motif partner protein
MFTTDLIKPGVVGELGAIATLDYLIWPEPMPNDFFSERADQSVVKARIVTSYFIAWARIIAPRSARNDGRVAYIDLYAGPGRYEDGSASTPLMVLTEALKVPKLREGLVAILNDRDENHTATLEKEIAALNGIGGLKYKPEISSGEVDRTSAEYFERTKLIPTFSFIDPFGYKGLSWALIRGVIKDWGSDCVFFFNYARINAGVSNPSVFEHMEALFGEDNFKEMIERLPHKPAAREKIILEYLTKAMTEAGAKYVLPFRFRNNNGKRTTHYLIFVSKHPLGYEIMKGIMAPESSQFEQGVPSLEYSPAVAGFGTLFPRALNELEDALTIEFAGKTISMSDIYHTHNIGTRYIERNYKDALLNLERSGRIVANPPKRRANTFGDNVMATFPPKPKARK